MNTLAERVAESIEASGKSVREISALCGIAPQTIYQWMNGTSGTIKGEALIDFAKIANREAGWIIKGELPKQRLCADDEYQMRVLTAMNAAGKRKGDLMAVLAEAIANIDKRDGIYEGIEKRKGDRRQHDRRH